jgi:lipopolysaccharide/colanic/teichoic acid biosynthesis glycosyltransferase
MKRIVRRCVDVVVSGVVLLVTLPILLLAALALKLTSPRDPVVVREIRLGSHDEPFELPRWWNVVRGDMSIVGPPPSDPSSDMPRPDADPSHEVLPGLTGTWATKRRAS